MCEFITALLAAGGGAAAGATATGAAAGAATAATAGSFIQTAGTIMSVVGPVFAGIQGAQAANAQAELIGQQKQTEAQLTAVKDQRATAQFMSQIRKQFAELASRGVGLDSPTAVLLGQEAAREMSFNSQSIRSTGQAKQQELTGSQKILKARASQSILRGFTTGAGNFLTAAPEVWPEMFA